MYTRIHCGYKCSTWTTRSPTYLLKEKVVFYMHDVKSDVKIEISLVKKHLHGINLVVLHTVNSIYMILIFPATWQGLVILFQSGKLALVPWTRHSPKHVQGYGFFWRKSIFWVGISQKLGRVSCVIIHGCEWGSEAKISKGYRGWPIIIVGNSAKFSL